MSSPSRSGKKCDPMKLGIVAVVIVFLGYVAYKIVSKCNSDSDYGNAGYPNASNYRYNHLVDDDVRDRVEQPYRNNFPRRNIRKRARGAMISADDSSPSQNYLPYQ